MTVGMSEADVTKLVLQNRRLVNLLAAVNKQLVRGQSTRLHDAIAAHILMVQIDEELARSAVSIVPTQTPGAQ